MNTVVVLGGSFNPPTKAHKLIMDMAVNKLNADKGIYVPSSNNYVTRKMNKSKDSMIFSEDERVQMLNSMCTDKTTVSKVEFNNNLKGCTYETLCKIRDENSDSKIWFIIGADKLGILPRWTNHNKLLAEFKLLVFSRNFDNPYDSINTNKVLSKYRSSFNVIQLKDSITDISSSDFRNLYITNKEKAREIVTDAVWKIIEKHKTCIEN